MLLKIRVDKSNFFTCKGIFRLDDIYSLYMYMYGLQFAINIIIHLPVNLLYFESDNINDWTDTWMMSLNIIYTLYLTKESKEVFYVVDKTLTCIQLTLTSDYKLKVNGVSRLDLRKIWQLWNYLNLHLKEIHFCNLKEIY